MAATSRLRGSSVSATLAFLRVAYLYTGNAPRMRLLLSLPSLQSGGLGRGKGTIEFGLCEGIFGTSPAVY